MKRIIAITHDKNFHADDVTATALLEHFCNYFRYDFTCYRYNRVKYMYDTKHIEEASLVVVYDIGRRFELNVFDSDLQKTVHYLDHHQDPQLPCAAVLMLNWLMQFALEQDADQNRIDEYSGFLKTLSPIFKTLSTWDTEGMPLPQDSVFRLPYAYLGTRLDLTDGQYDFKFMSANMFMKLTINNWFEAYRIDNERILTAQKLESQELVNGFKVAFHYKPTLTAWDSYYDFLVTKDIRTKGHYKILRHDKHHDKVNFNTMSQFDEIGVFRHSNGFLMTFHSDTLPEVLNALKSILKHYVQQGPVGTIRS